LRKAKEEWEKNKKDAQEALRKQHELEKKEQEER